MTARQRGSEEVVRALIERWVAAVRAGDLDAVLADHTEDIQMFSLLPGPRPGRRWGNDSERGRRS